MLNKILKNDRLSQILFFIGYATIVFEEMSKKIIMLQEFLPIFRKIGIALLILVACKQVYEKRKNYKYLIAIFLMFIFSIIVLFVIKEKMLGVLFLILVAYGDKDIKKFIKTDVFFRTISMLLIITLYFLKFTDNYNFMYKENIMRYSMGFTHPNYFAHYLFIICMEFMYLKKEKINFWNYVIIIGYIIVIYIYTKTKTTMICLAILLICTILYKFKKEIYNNKIIKFAIINAFLILTLLSLFMVYGFNIKNSFFIKLNNGLSNRISMTSEFMKQYNLTLFGKQIQMRTTEEVLENGGEIFVLDNVYILILLKYGIVSIIISCLVYRRLIKDIYKKEDYFLIIIWFLMCINGFNENHIYMIWCNPFLLTTTYLLNNLVEDKKSKKFLERGKNE